MTEINQKEYLKKYLAIGRDPSKKKKKKKPKSVTSSKTKIIDDDMDANAIVVPDEDPFAANEDAPQIVAIIDERPPSLRIDDKTKDHLWQPIGSADNEPTEQMQILKGGFKINKAGDSHKKLPDNMSLRKNAYTSPPRRDKVRSPKRKGETDYENVVIKQEIEDVDDNLIRDRSEQDFSPPRRQRSDSDTSPPRKRRNAEDSSPSRRSRTSPDSSPPRKRKTDIRTPPRRSRASPDSSPPRKRKTDDSSPPRRSRTNSDSSPPRKRKNSDSSPPRKRKTDDSSPPRKRRVEEVSSPPRKRRDPDHSPPRRRGATEDVSPPRRKSRRSPSPGKSKKSSPPRRKSRWGDDTSPPRRVEIKKEKDDEISGKMEKTLDGKTAGLVRARQLADETKKLRQQEDELFKKMSHQDNSSETIKRDRKTGRKINPLEEEERQTKKREEEEKTSEKYARWGRGLAQVENREQKIAEELHEMSKPLARYADDEDLERFLKQREREEDPMLNYMRQKKRKQLAKMGIVEKPQFEGNFMPNRYGIKPGHRWDGVDRSSGYEKKWFEVQNSKTAQQEETYKWSTEDM